ncbi:MAG TPA: type VI secretion system tube protein Hcp [Steroidobacteraceae bacterium]|nr:type VI secretion system tube protein Hcp [Steroidobacteraceae bacterium]
MFLELDGIKGESIDKVHKEKIDLLAWSWGLSNTGTFHGGEGGGAGKANFQDISFTKYVDKGSADLMYAIASGKHIAKGKLIVRKAGENPLEYLTYNFEKILVSSMSTGGSGGEERLTENVTINFATVKMEYWTQGEKGAKGKNSNFGWDIPANAKA